MRKTGLSAYQKLQKTNPKATAKREAVLASRGQTWCCLCGGAIAIETGHTADDYEYCADCL